MKAVDQDGGEWGRKTMVGSSQSEGSQVWVGGCMAGGGGACIHALVRNSLRAMKSGVSCQERLFYWL